jgi:hypothetical protein
LVATCGTGSNSSRTIVHNPPPERVAENERPVEYIIARFRFLLDELTTKFVENRKQIAEMTVKSHELLQQKGVEEFLLNVMKGINKIMPTTIGNQQYAEYTAAFITLLQQGQSHNEAVAGLRALIGSMGVK